MTVLVTTHYMDEADHYCDRIALMHRGRIRAQGTPAELKAGVGLHATLDEMFRASTGDELAPALFTRAIQPALWLLGRLAR